MKYGERPESRTHIGFEGDIYKINERNLYSFEKSCVRRGMLYGLLVGIAISSIAYGVGHHLGSKSALESIEMYKDSSEIESIIEDVENSRQ